MRTILLIILILLLLGAVPKWPGELEILSKWRTRIGVTDRSDIGFNRPFVVEARAKSDSTCHNFVSPSRFIEDFPGRGNPVAYYKHSRYLAQSDHDIFDKTLDPGINTPYSGIYRCEVCGSEATSIKDNPLPPWNHHQHRPGQGPIRWRLVVGHQPDPNR